MVKQLVKNKKNAKLYMTEESYNLEKWLEKQNLFIKT
jgi:hypothetical protein